MDQTLYNALVHIHSVGRWVVLILLVFGILNSLIAGSRPYIRTDNRLGLLLTTAADLMFLVGVILYFFGDRGYKLIQRNGFNVVAKDAFLRFWALEHMAGMLIAIILIHIGKSQGRKHISDKAKHRRTMIFHLVALLITLVSVPWPFRHLVGAGRGWY